MNWALLKPLWLGGLAGAGAGIGLIVFSVRADFTEDFLRVPLAIVILIPAGSMVYRQFGRATPAELGVSRNLRDPGVLALGGCAVIGLVVSLTSVGAGALGMALLTRLSPHGREPKELVGTDLMFAVPITLVAGLTYSVAGFVDFGLLLNLVSGSVQGVLLGSYVALRLRGELVSVVIAGALITAATLPILVS